MVRFLKFATKKRLIEKLYFIQKIETIYYFFSLVELFYYQRLYSRMMYSLNYDNYDFGHNKYAYIRVQFYGAILQVPKSVTNLRLNIFFNFKFIF